ncbi:hypothetical protein ACKGJN_05675 [Gillisia sp. Q332]|uniref:hypothetical protein n=1 Tax=Gillisia xinjiangensis TaxID=3384765 RepID=UPI00391CED45
MRQLKYYNLFWGTILVLLIILSITYAFISTDAPYYLSIARDISQGSIPYKDIFSSYTPVVMYLNSLIHFFFDDPAYHIFLAFQYLIIASSVWVFYKICQKEGLENVSAAFLSLFLFIAVLSSDGTYINLEVYLIFFVLLSYLMVLYRYFFMAGIFLSLSFFCKQYGIFNFLPFFLLVITLYGYQKKYLVKFLAGGVLPLIVFLFYFVFLEKVGIQDLALQLTGSGYDQEMIELETTWFRFLAGSKVFLLLLLPLFLLRINPFKDRISAILIIGIVANLIPLYVQTVSHYFILSFPYIFILFARNFNKSNRIFFITSNLVLLIITGLLLSRIYRYREVYNEQLAVAAETRKEYSVGSEVFLYKHYRFLYILNDYRNPVLKEVGYRYGFKPDLEFQKKYNVLIKD